MKKFVKNTALIAFALVLVSITCNRSNTAMAESETVLYDMVWKIVNKKPGNFLPELFSFCSGPDPGRSWFGHFWDE